MSQFCRFYKPIPPHFHKKLNCVCALCGSAHEYIYLHFSTDCIFWQSIRKICFRSARNALCSMGPFIIALYSFSNDCTRGGNALAQRLKMLLQRAVWDWAPVSQYSRYWAKSWRRARGPKLSRRSSAEHTQDACLNVHVLLWCVSPFVFLRMGPDAYVCLCVSWLPVMDTDVSISSGPSDTSSILNQFGSGLRAWEGRKDGPHGWQ